MNRSRIIRRAAALAAGSLVATAAMLASAAPASAHHNTVSGKCAAGTDGSYVVTWTVENSEDDITSPVKSVSFTPGDGASTLTGIKEGDVLPVRGKVLTATQTVKKQADKDAQWATLKVVSTWDRDVVREFEGSGSVKLTEELCGGKPDTPPNPSPSAPVEPSPSASASPEPEPTLPPLPGEPEVDIVFTCDEVQFILKNPKDSVDFELIFIPSTGDKVTKKFPAGETTTVKFPAKKGFKVVVTAEDWEGEKVEIPWEQPEDCDNGEGGGLPVTGTAVGGIAAGAAVLLAIGGGLFVMARRRRIRFTA